MILLRDLHKAYPEGGRLRQVLQGFTLSVAAGEQVALIGRSGAGKSTVLNLVAGMDAPDRGDVVVAGRPVGAMSEAERTLYRRRHVGFVFQFFNLIPTLTVSENLCLPLELVGRFRSRRGARELAAAWLDRVGLGDRGDAFPERLSGGEQQRVAIARALIHEPDLLLADEPTGTLDRDTGQQVLSLLCDLGRERGMTLLFVTHSEALAARMDRVVEVVDGRAVPVSGQEPAG